MLNSLSINGVAARCVAVPVVGDFKPPEYYFGQCLWHRVNLPAGKTLYPVVVFGMIWTGTFWQYAVELPDYHPHFKTDDSEYDWVDSFELSTI